MKDGQKTSEQIANISLDSKQVCQLLNISRSHFEKVVKSNGFPKSLPFMNRKFLYSKTQVLEWFSKQANLLK